MTKAFIIYSAIYLLLILPYTSAAGFRGLDANTAVNAVNTQTSGIVGNNNSVDQSAANNVAATSNSNAPSGVAGSTAAPTAANTAVNAVNNQSSAIVGNGNTVSQSATNNVVAASVANGTLSPNCLMANPANADAETAVNAVNNQISGIVGSNNAVDQSAINNIVASALAAGGIVVNPVCVTPPPASATTAVNAQNNQASAIQGNNNDVSQSAANNVAASSNGGS